MVTYLSKYSMEQQFGINSCSDFFEKIPSKSSVVGFILSERAELTIPIFS